MIPAAIRQQSLTRWKARTLVVCLLLQAVMIPVHGTEPKKGSPEEVLDRFFKMINDGELLSRDGWRRAAKMFERQSSGPDKEVIFVVTKFPRVNGPLDVKGDRAVAEQKWVDDVGSIDSRLRYHPPPKEDLDVEGVIRVVRLVHTGEHWELAADSRLEEIKGPPEWRIEGSLTARTASREAAIQYLTSRRDEVTDPALKANAERTVAILRGLPKRRTHI